MWQRCSASSLVVPYGENGWGMVVSDVGNRAACPYMDEEDAKTKRFSGAMLAASSRCWVASTLLRRYASKRSPQLERTPGSAAGWKITPHSSTTSARSPRVRSIGTKSKFSQFLHRSTL